MPGGRRRSRAGAPSPGSQIIVRRVGELDGIDRGAGRQELGAQADGGDLLADGTYELTNVPAIVDVSIMGELLAAIGVASQPPGAGRAAS